MSESLNSFLFSTREMSLVFSPQSQLSAMVRFEWALTLALEKNGLAAGGSSQHLEHLLDAQFIDLRSLQRDATDAGNIVIPFVRQLTSAVKDRSESASRVIHLGATSQDVLDTCLILHIRAALLLVDDAVVQLDSALVGQIRAHAGTVLSGRTWLQPGPPVTLGLKLAGTLAALRRDRERLRCARERALVLQFGGAVGTLASLGEAAAGVTRELARILDLQEPEIPWHTHRDRLVELVQVLAMLVGTLSKFARDIALLMQSEIGEAFEGISDSRGGSSTMPQKHNPVSCAAVLAIHGRMPALAATMLQAMPQEHERGLGLWQAEWDTVPDSFRLAAAALSNALEIARNLQVDAARMQANLDALMGTNMSEAISMALASRIGHSAAHALVRDAVSRARKDGCHLAEVLKQSSQVLQHLSPGDIDRLMNPSEYLGSAQRFIATVLGDGNA